MGAYARRQVPRSGTPEHPGVDDTGGAQAVPDLEIQVYVNYVGNIPAAIHVANLPAHDYVAVTFRRRRQPMQEIRWNRVAAFPKVGIEYSAFANPAFIRGTELVLGAKSSGGFILVLIVIVLSGFAILVAELLPLLTLSSAILPHAANRQ